MLIIKEEVYTRIKGCTLLILSILFNILIFDNPKLIVLLLWSAAATATLPTFERQRRLHL